MVAACEGDLVSVELGVAFCESVELCDWVDACVAVFEPVIDCDWLSE